MIDKTIIKKIYYLSTISFFAILLSACTQLGKKLPSETSKEKTVVEQTMMQLKLTSSAFHNGLNIPKRYTCDGENLNPPLSIEGIPEHTESLALIVEDPDAPSGTFIHWLVWNISPQYDEIPENSYPPSSLQGLNDFGERGWSGPCPPPGPEHRYLFKIYALDKILEIRKDASKVLLEQAMESHIIAQAELIGRYGRGR